MNPVSALASLPSTEPTAKPAAAPAEDRDLWDRIWGKEGFSFGALLDIVNPLQHIPVVSTIYRSITGDTIGPGPRIAGGAIFGGVVGLIASAADATIEAVTGEDTGSHVLAMLPEPDAEPMSQWADNERRGQRPQMAGLMNAPDGGTFFADGGPPPDSGDGAATASASAAADTTDMTKSDSAKDDLAKADPSKSDQAAGTVAGQPAAHLFAPPARSARLGAGGRLVPLTTGGRAQGVTPVSLPSPQSVAADPALLRELRQGGAAAAHKMSGRMDTAIKGHGLVTPGATATAFDTETKKTDGKSMAPQNGPAAIPEVGPEFLMKMQQALDKYQAMRNSTPPSVDLSH